VVQTREVETIDEVKVAARRLVELRMYAATSSGVPTRLPKLSLSSVTFVMAGHVEGSPVRPRLTQVIAHAVEVAHAIASDLEGLESVPGEGGQMQADGEEAVRGTTAVAPRSLGP